MLVSHHHLQLVSCTSWLNTTHFLELWTAKSWFYEMGQELKEQLSRAVITPSEMFTTILASHHSANSTKRIWTSRLQFAIWQTKIFASELFLPLMIALHSVWNLLKMSYLESWQLPSFFVFSKVTLFDRNLKVFKNSPNSFLAFLINFWPPKM